MESYISRIPSTFLLGIFIFLSTSPLLSKGDYPEYDEEQIIERLKAIEDPLIDYQFNAVVRGYIKGYLFWNRAKAERVTGRTMMYYPMMEKYIKEKNLPEKLKYLPVVESALNPHAVSPVGAVGLWQFMPGTAEDHGLIINKLVDERKDPHKSTQAALSYLEREYKKYGDWALALAAYNGGSGRVSRAIKRGRSKNFWKIRRYLPRETRNYVPAYIAATYLMEYYKEHEVSPDYPSLELQISEYTKVYHAISFHRIAQITGLSLELIELLNPAYKRKIIPENVEGNFVILPSRVMPAFKEYLESLRPDQEEEPFFDDTLVKVEKDAASKEAENYVKGFYRVGEDESLSEVATYLHCTNHQLIAWNKLKSEDVSSGKTLIFYQPKELIRIPVMTSLKMPQEIATSPLVDRLKPRKQIKRKFIQQEYLFYLVTRKESLAELADSLPGISFPMLMDYNQLPADHKVKRGDLIRIPLSHK